ncbi:Transcription factor steA [Yarrowia sp. B02]|nr:Transcription factor steA [Yarrowia sp. B02]
MSSIRDMLPQLARDALAQVDDMKFFLATAPANWQPGQIIRRYYLPTEEFISCVLWKGLYHITGTDIVRCISFRFEAFGRSIKNRKKFEEGIFSDLRGLKCNSDAVLESPKSPFLEFLYKNSCIRTQKKQKVYYWFSVPHDRLFVDALERDMRRELNNLEPTTEAHAEPAKSFNFDLNESLYEQLMKVTNGEGIPAVGSLPGGGQSGQVQAQGSAPPVVNGSAPPENQPTGQIASQTVANNSAYALSDYLSTPTEYLTSMQQQLQNQIQLNQQQMASNPEYNQMVQLGGSILHGQQAHPSQQPPQQSQQSQPQQQQQQQQQQHKIKEENDESSDFPLDYFPPSNMDMPYLDQLYEQAPLSATYAAFPFDQTMNAATALMTQQQGPQAAPPAPGAPGKQYPSSIIPDYPDYELEHQTYIINGKVIHGTDYRQNMVIKTPLFWDFVDGKDGPQPLPPSSQPQDSSDESESKKRTSSEFERDDRGVKRAKSAVFDKSDETHPHNPQSQAESSVHEEPNEQYMLQSGPHVSEVPKSYRNTSLAASLARNGITKKGKVPPPLSLAKPGMAPQPVYPGHHGHAQGPPHDAGGTSEYSTIIGEDGLPHYVQRE